MERIKILIQSMAAGVDKLLLKDLIVKQKAGLMVFQF